MSDGDALLTALLSDPDDETLRLAYSDWLQEQGAEERAELMRSQCWFQSPSVMWKFHRQITSGEQTG